MPNEVVSDIIPIMINPFDQETFKVPSNSLYRCLGTAAAHIDNLIINSLSVPLKNAFKELPASLVQLIKSRDAGFTDANVLNAKVFPGKIRDFIKIVDNFNPVDPKTKQRPINNETNVSSQISFSLKYLLDISLFTMEEFLSEFKYTTANSVHREIIPPELIQTLDSEGVIAFLFRFMVFNGSYYPIFEDPKLAPIGYVRISSPQKKYTTIRPLQSPGPFYTESNKTFSNIVTFMIGVTDNTLTNVINACNFEFCKNQNAFIQLRDLYDEVNESKARIEFFNPYTWS